MTLKDYSQIKFQVEMFNNHFHPICLKLSKSFNDDKIVANLSFNYNEGLLSVSSSDNMKETMNSIVHFTKVMKAVEHFNQSYGSLLLEKFKEKESIIEPKYEEVSYSSDDWWHQS